jgi:2-polyprenyl-3-methyl-5-hydroxy-6-metoxy-1,4-benzoquinol methylase
LLATVIGGSERVCDVEVVHLNDDPYYNAPRSDMLRFLPNGVKRVLDVGCGGGGFGRSLRSSLPDVHVYGVEPQPQAASYASEGGYDQVAVGGFPEAMTQLQPRKYDAIFFNDVLEHMPDPERALVAAHDYLEHGGTLIASIPNVRHFSVIWPLVRHGDWRYEDSGIMDRTHLRFFTARTMRELFQETGWFVIAVTGANRTRWPIGGVDTWKTRTLSRLTLGRSDTFFFTQYVVEASSTRPG